MTERLRTGAMVLAYKQEEYISYALRSIAPFVDHVVVMYSEAPFAASRTAERFGTPDRTRAIVSELCEAYPNIEVVEGAWDSEPDERQAALCHLRRRDVDVCLIVDADEIYPDGIVQRVLDEVRTADHPGAVYYARYVTCYRRFDHVVESDHRTPIAVHLDENTEFAERPRRPTGPRLDLAKEIFFWHMGYVLTDARMWEKIHTFSHAHEVLPDWYEEKWLRWTPNMKNLFRKTPASRWPHTVAIDPRSLPRMLHDHPYFPAGPVRESDTAGS